MNTVARWSMMWGLIISAAWVLLCVAEVCSPRRAWVAVPFFALFAWLVFRDSRGLVQSFGPVIWTHVDRTTSDESPYAGVYAMDRPVGFRWIVEDGYPNRVGWGVAVALGQTVVMIALGRRHGTWKPDYTAYTTLNADTWKGASHEAVEERNEDIDA